MCTSWIFLFAICGVLHGAVHITSDIGCDQSTEGFGAKGQIVSFQFAIDQKQDVQLVDTNNSFVPILKVKDSNNRYIDGAFTTDCDRKECEGTVFTMKRVAREVYIVEMIVDDDGDFKVDMVCSIDDQKRVDVSQGTVLYHVIILSSYRSFLNIRTGTVHWTFIPFCKFTGGI